MTQDCIIEVLTRMAYHDLEEELRALGLINDQTAKVICRWRVDGYSPAMLSDLLIEIYIIFRYK